MYKSGVWAMTAILLRRLLKQPKLYLVLLLIGFALDGACGGARGLFASYRAKVNGFGCFACVTSYSYLLLWITIGYLVLISDVPFLTPMEQFTRMRLSGKSAMMAKAVYLLVVSIGYAVMMWLMTTVIAGGTLATPFSWDKALRTMSMGQFVGDVLIYAPRVIVNRLSPLLAWARAILSMTAVMWAVGLSGLFLSTVALRKLVICLMGIFSALSFAIQYMGLGDFLHYAAPFSWCMLEHQLTAAQHVGRPSELYCLIAPWVLIAVSLFLILHVSAKPKHMNLPFNMMEE